MRDHSRLHLGLVPWSIVDDQDAEHANDGNRNRNNQRRAAASPHLISARMIFRHFNAASWFPLTESNPGDNEGSPLLSISRPRACGTNFLPMHCSGSSATSHSATLLSELQNVNTETPELSQPGMAERAIDTATDVSRTITEASAALRAAVDRSQQRDCDGAATGKAARDDQRNHPRSAARQPVRRLSVRGRGRTATLALPFGARFCPLRICPSLRPWLPT